MASINSVSSGDVPGHSDASIMRSSSYSEAKKPSSLSSLTMRFMPLIECYLTVCSSTLLVHPPGIVVEAEEKSKRDRDDDSNPTNSHNEASDSLSPVPLSRSTSKIGTMISSAVRLESLPGYRFR